MRNPTLSTDNHELGPCLRQFKKPSDQTQFKSLILYFGRNGALKNTDTLRIDLKFSTLILIYTVIINLILILTLAATLLVSLVRQLLPPGQHEPRLTTCRQSQSHGLSPARSTFLAGAG